MEGGMDGRKEEGVEGRKEGNKEGKGEPREGEVRVFLRNKYGTFIF